MKVPEPRKLSSGKWFIQLRLGGESVSISDFDRKKCIREAQAIKAEYLAGKRVVKAKENGPEILTLNEIVDTYIKNKSNTLSPSTIRGYRSIQKNRFQDIMEKSPITIPDNEWQSIVNQEAALCSPKYIKNAWAFICTAVLHVTGKKLPEVSIPAIPPAEHSFLHPGEIKPFIEAVKDTPYALPALLALSSLRISEISALDWKNIPKKPQFIRVSGAAVYSENGLVKKPQNKNRTSTRNVPIMIPELLEVIERDRKPDGPVLHMGQNTLRRGIHQVCRTAGVHDVTVHGLRHSFASLAYHLQIPERITLEIGGWSDIATMQKIYTHIAQSDVKRYETKMADFFKNANKNAN